LQTRIREKKAGRAHREKAFIRVGDKKELIDPPTSAPPLTTAMGSLIGHITDGAFDQSFQPMNVNFGLLPPFEERIHKKQRKAAYAKRARDDFKEWLNSAA
jgi:methylenetetrahydrofolate--tRNA-(uracil-5-)-methyltransferase